MVHPGLRDRFQRRGAPGLDEVRMTRPPSLTVLMPVYNGEKHLREAVDSILGQSYHDFELRVIDDGSTDASLAILKSIRDPRMKIVRQARNQGLIKTLNRAFSAVSSRYIARMDAHD